MAVLLMANGTQWRRAQGAPDAEAPLPALPADVMLSLVRALATEPSRWLHVAQTPLRLQRPSDDDRAPLRVARGVPPYFYSA